MGEPGRISDATTVTMTAEGHIPIPATIRERAGLTPGAAVRVGINDRGEAVVLPAEGVAADARRDRFQSRLERSLETGIAREPAPADRALTKRTE